jgi:histone H3/H4
MDKDIPSTVISRISEKSGVTSLSKNIYEHINKVVKSHLTDILTLSKEIMEYNDESTIRTDYLLEAIVLGGIRRNGESNFEKCRESDKLKLEIDLKEYSDHPEFSLFISKNKFKSLVQNVLSVNLSDNAISNLHVYTEIYLQKLFKNCSLVMKHTKKKILHIEDIELVVGILESFWY